VRGGEYNVGIPIVGYDLKSMGSIVFTIRNGGLTTVNTTLPTHILYDGVVIRTATHESNGDWAVETHGYGNDHIPGIDIANQIGGPVLFNTEDTQMYLHILMDQLGKP
jgi:hypothetical protein